MDKAKAHLFKVFEDVVNGQVGQKTHKIKQQLGSLRDELREIKAKLAGAQESNDRLRKELKIANAKIEELVAKEKERKAKGEA